MNKWTRAIAVTAAHLAIVCSLGAKLLIDRARLPRVWVQVRPYDPDLPIRGRYLALQLMVNAPKLADDCQESSWTEPVAAPFQPGTSTPPKKHIYHLPKQHLARLVAENGKLWVVPDEKEGSVRYQWPCQLTSDDSPSWMTGSTQAGRAMPRNVEPYLLETVPYFIPERADDPSRRPAGEELWLEVTVPRKGPPRPIQLGLKRDDVIKPLDLY